MWRRGDGIRSGTDLINALLFSSLRHNQPGDNILQVSCSVPMFRSRPNMERRAVRVTSTRFHVSEDEDCAS